VFKVFPRSAFGFCLECAGQHGEIVLGRSGIATYSLRVFGKASHSADAPKGKASAILEMAKKIIEIEALNSYNEGILVNVGIVSGGLGANTIAPETYIKLETRYENKAQEISIMEKLNKICSETDTPNISFELKKLTARPPMHPSQKMQAMYQHLHKTALELNVEIGKEKRAGVSDANLIATQNVPILDGFGPIGKYDHSEREYITKQSLLNRCLLFSVYLKQSWELYQNNELFIPIES